MPRPTPRRTPAHALIAVLLALACSSSTIPETPFHFVDGEMPRGERVRVPLSLGGVETVRFELLSLELIQGEALLPLSIGLAMGFETADGCSVSSSRRMAVGDSWLLHLPRDAYCLTVFDIGTIPEEGIAAFSVGLFEIS